MMSSSGTIFTKAEQQTDFERDGYYLFGSDERVDINALQEIFESYESDYRTAFSASILLSNNELRAATHLAVSKLLAAFVQKQFCNYRQVFSGFAVKRADPEGGAMPLHQDISMLAPGARPGLSLWIPLIDTNETNGALQVVPGSHLHYRHERAPGTPFPLAEKESLLRNHYLKNIFMQAGQALVMDQALFHASPTNRSNTVRVAATSVLIPAEAPLKYFHRHFINDEAVLDAFLVPDDFFVHHRIGTRPDERYFTAQLAEKKPDPSIQLTYTSF